MDASAGLLILNAGSSGLKFACYDRSNPGSVLCQGSIPRKGAAPDPDAELAAVLEGMHALGGAPFVAAVGHRVVHGGPELSGPAAITPALLSELRLWGFLDPAHVEGEIALIAAAQRRFPVAAQVACFDTAFHHDLPRLAQLMAIPFRFQALGLRRFGFHGLSYQFLMEELERLTGPANAGGRVLLAHLGHGASLAAVVGGRPLDTTMGLTPAGGLVMGTRSGDIDPGLPFQLARLDGMNAAAMDRLLSAESGLLGLSGTTSDLEALMAAQDKDPRAADAVGLFCYQLKKGIGAMVAVMGGVDTLVFGGGIGEHAASIRSRCMEGLDCMGLGLDETLNAHHAGVISPSGAPVTVRVIATDEQRLMARLVAEHLNVLKL